MTIKLTITLPPWDPKDWKSTTAELFVSNLALVLAPISNFRNRSYLPVHELDYVVIFLPTDQGGERTIYAKVIAKEHTDLPPSPTDPYDIDAIINPCVCTKMTHLAFVQVTQE